MSVINEFLEYLQVNRNRSASTVATYRPLLVRLEKFLLEDKKALLTATVRDLELWTGPALHKEGLDARTRAKAVSAVRSFFSWAERAGLVSRSPAGALHRPKLPDSLPSAWTLEQAEKLIWAPDLTTFKGVRDAAILAFLVATGCRVSGLVGLNETDIWSEEIDGERWAFAQLREKGAKSRKVPLPKLALVPLLMYLGHDERQALDEGRHHLRVDDTRVMFCNLRAGKCPSHEWYGERRRLTRRAVWGLIKWYGRQECIPEHLLHPHAARHLMGTHLYDEGIAQEDRMAMMGHQRPETLGIYTRLSRKRLLQIAGKSNPLAAIKTPFDDLAEVVGGPAPASTVSIKKQNAYKGK